MEIPVDKIPPEAKAVLDDLQGRGYSVAQEDYDAANFGDATIVLARGPTKIRLVRDHEDWFVEVAARDDWFSPVIWRTFFESSLGSLENVPFAEQGRWLLEDLDQIEAIGDVSRRQLARLNKWQSRRYKARQKLRLW